MFLFNPDSGENFIGREKEIDFIIEQFRLGQNVVLTAPRRFGKTTLIREIISRLKQCNFYTAYIDIFPVTSINHLSSEITEAVLENHNLGKEFQLLKKHSGGMINHPELKKETEDFDFLLRFSEKSVDNYNLLGNCIDFIEQFSVRHKKRMVCVFEEFGDIKKLDDGKLTKLFKSKISKHINTSYLFSGSYESVMSSTFEGIKAPFYHIARKISLEEINKQHFQKLFETLFENYHIPFQEGLFNRILDFTNGHPYYSQLAIQEIIIHHLVTEKIPEFGELVQKMILSEKDYLEKMWEDIATSKQHIKTILTVTKGETGIYSSLRNSNVNIYRSLKTLVGNGTLLVNPDKTYRMSDPLLNFWIKQNAHRQDLKIT
jgi:uncharacterized protein